jgi:hypothetical protein
MCLSIEGNGCSQAKERGASSPPTKFGRKKGARTSLPDFPKQPLATRPLLLSHSPSLFPSATASSIGPNLRHTRLRISRATSKGILQCPPSSAVRLACRGAGIDPGLVCSLSPVTNPNFLGSFFKFWSGVLLVPILEAVMLIICPVAV